MPNVDVSDLNSTIIPKSDQLNADQLIGGPMTVTVTSVTMAQSDEQPISVHYEGENGRPFKPCKTMRRVLIFGWGADGREWAGRSMTLYQDPSVRFGGDEVGGVRISHMSDIARDLSVNLTATRGKKKLYTIKRMERAAAGSVDKRMSRIADLEIIAREQGEKAFKRAWNATPQDQKDLIGESERDRILALGKAHDTAPADAGRDADDDTREAA